MITKSKNTIIGLKELRLNTQKYINRLNKGESFTVVRRSKPVFRVTPFDEEDDSLWETVVDFTDGGKRRGMPADDVLKIIKKIRRN